MASAALLADIAEAEDEDAAGIRTLLTFRLGAQDLAVDVSQVREILDLQPVASLPGADPSIVGLIDVRGEGVALVDLAGRLGAHGEGGDEDARIIVLDLPDGESGRGVLGFRADRVIDVVEIAPEAVESVPAAAGSRGGGAVVGVTRLDRRLVTIVDLEALLAAPSW